MNALLSLLLLAACTAPAADPTCGTGDLEPLRRAGLQEVAALREKAGRAPLESHPALCELALWRANEVARSGSPNPSKKDFLIARERLYAAGYKPHNWIESTLIGGWEEGMLAQWRKASSEWVEKLREGDFEHIGIAIARSGTRPVYTLVLAMPGRTIEWRQAEPLADLEAVRRTMLEAVNEERRERGRPPLTQDSKLDTAAQAHAEDMLRRAFYAHESPEGTTTRDRAEAAGYLGARMMGENIAKGPFTPGEVVGRWMDSSGHRRNIVHPRFERFGAGVAFGENENGFEVLWVQVFARGGG